MNALHPAGHSWIGEPVKKRLFTTVICVLMLCSALILQAGAVDYSKTASASDMTTVEQVAYPGLIPVFAEDIENGDYDVNMECSSSMFRIQSATLHVAEDGMTVDIRLHSESYTKLFSGKAEEAAKADESAYIDYTVDDEGNYVFTLPVEALDQAFSVAAFSINKELWYDRDLLIRADSLPEEALKVTIADYEALKKQDRENKIEQQKQEKDLASLAADLDAPDGEYSVDVSLEGGSGKASITSPAMLQVKDGKAVAEIEWSSPHYDYMIVEGQKILPETKASEDENSKFLIPITDKDGKMDVIADTTAMSTPHEIEYTLSFDLSGLHKKSAARWLLPVVLLVLLCAAWILFQRKKKQ